jgi:hypothetical protein
MRLPDGREVPDPGFLSVIVMLFFLYWGIASLVWSWRNPTANPMTHLRYIGNVLAFEKLDEFQVPSSK